jgi:hypothetical protein
VNDSYHDSEVITNLFQVSLLAHQRFEVDVIAEKGKLVSIESQNSKTRVIIQKEDRKHQNDSSDQEDQRLVDGAAFI